MNCVPQCTITPTPANKPGMGHPSERFLGHPSIDFPHLPVSKGWYTSDESVTQHCLSHTFENRECVGNRRIIDSERGPWQSTKEDSQVAYPEWWGSISSGIVPEPRFQNGRREVMITS